MLNEMESYEITEWVAYFKIKNDESKKQQAKANAEARARGR